MFWRPALLVVLATGCLPSVHDVIASAGEADRMVIDTERVCARPAGAAYSQVSLSTGLWTDLARRADERPPDRETLHTIIRLMHANRDRFRDSVCTDARIDTLETAARQTPAEP